MEITLTTWGQEAVMGCGVPGEGMILFWLLLSRGDTLQRPQDDAGHGSGNGNGNGNGNCQLPTALPCKYI